MSKIQRLYDHIKLDSDLIFEDESERYVELDNLVLEGGEFETLSLEEWIQLIGKLYLGPRSTEVKFGDSELGEHLSEIIDYTDPDTLEDLFQPPPTPPRGEGAAETPSPFKPGQGHENSCFAHAAANMILHNVYKLRLNKSQTKVFLEKNCNQYLDTSKPLEDYATIEADCGVIGAKRILLFHYIYNVIKNKFGTNRGVLRDSILFYLQQPFQDVLSAELGEKIRDEFEDGKRRDYTLSVVPIDEFDIKAYGPYFEEYYASIHVRKPAHFFTIVRINPTIKGKDSSTGKSFTIPTREFKSTGIITIDDSIWENISSIYFLFETSKLPSYPEIVQHSVVTMVLPLSLGAALEAAEKGGRKSRKRRKTRKRSRKLKCVSRRTR